MLFKTLGSRLRWLRENEELSQEDMADDIGLDVRTISGHETDSQRPSKNTLKRYVSFFHCNEPWLRANKGETFSDLRGDPVFEDYPEIKRKKNRQRSGPGISNNFDSLGEASTGLREIFDSHDPILIPALQANIRAFQIAARREKEILELKGRVKKLEEKCDKFDEIKERLETLERNLPTAAGAGGL